MSIQPAPQPSRGPEIEDQRAYYDRRWALQDHRYANLLQLGRAAAVLEALARIGRREPRILDLGCGTGWLSGILGRFGPTTAIDLSPLAIDAARARYPDVEFLAGDFFDAPLPADSFDVVVSVQVIDHMTDHARFLDLVERLLGRGGHLILITTNPANIARWDPAAFERFSGGLQPIENWLTRKQLRALLERRFRIHELRTLLAGYGRRGLLRPAHSTKVAGILSRLGMLDAYHGMLLRLGSGLLVFSVASKRDA